MLHIWSVNGLLRLAVAQWPVICRRLRHFSREVVLSGSFATNADLDCCINVTCHLVSRVPPPQVPSAAQQVTAALTAKVRSYRRSTLAAVPTLVTEPLRSPL